MAVQSSLKNMVLCLAGVCLFCSAILALVYAVTSDPIRKASEQALAESIGRVLPEGLELSERRDENGMEYYVGTRDGVAGAYAVKASEIGFGGPLVLMVGVLPDGTVYNTSVLSHSETPGLGAKCGTDESFIGQWRGFSPDKVLKVKKDGGDVDAITASTITSRAYAKAVAKAVEVVKTLESSTGNKEGGQENE